MTEWIHPAVLLAVKAHEDFLTIFDKFRFYEAWPRDPNILMCFAVHYDHTQYISNVEVFSTECPYYDVSGRSMFNPFLTAIYGRKYSILFSMLNAIKIWDFTLLAYHQGYGKIQGSCLITDKPVAVWDAIFEIDDPVALKMLKYFCHSEPESLARLAKNHGARNCFQVIMNSTCQFTSTTWPVTVDRNHSHDFKQTRYQTCSVYLPKIGQVLERAFSRQGIMPPAIYEDALITWESLKVTGTRHFLTPADEDLVNRLLSGNRDGITQHCLKEYQESHNPIETDDIFADWKSELNLHGKVILESWQNVVENCEEAEAKQVAVILMSRLIGAMKAQNSQTLFQIGQQISSFHFIRARNLAIRMIEILLHCQPELDSKLLFWFITPFMGMLNVSEGRDIRRMFGRLFVYRYQYFRMDEWNNYTCVYLTEYMNKYDNARKVVLSLLPHDVYEDYRLFTLVRWRWYQSELEMELNKHAPDAERVRKTGRDMDSLNEFDSPRSLKAICRLSLYQHTLPGKLPQLARETEIPHELKEYLTLGVVPMC